jgi:SpoVK/Ycf46/Vps4 family AAA+-type ATPase
MWADEKSDTFFCMIDLHMLFDEASTQWCIRKHVQFSLKYDPRLFIVVPQHQAIPESIAPLVHVIDYDFPTRSELAETLDDIINGMDSNNESGASIEADFDKENRDIIVSNAQGMTITAFETAISLSMTDYVETNGSIDGFGPEHMLKLISSYKMQLLRKTQVLELQKPVPIEQVGGLENFKEWLTQRADTFSDHAKEMGITPSKGALVIGPPGTGKSMLAKAAGSILNMTVVRFDVGRVFGAFIGQSEQAMRSALSMLDAIAPCVLMLDEIDKGFAGAIGGGGDSGTTQRVFGTFLTWMQERDQENRPIFLLMTANRVHGLPPELLRKGRVDEIFAVGLSNREEVKSILNIHAKIRGHKISDKDMTSLLNITNGLVGAELEALVEDALVFALNDGRDTFIYEDFEQAKANLRPMSVTRKSEFDEMQRWAEQNARPASRATPKPERPATLKAGARRIRPVKVRKPKE